MILRIFFLAVSAGFLAVGLHLSYLLVVKNCFPNKSRSLSAFSVLSLVVLAGLCAVLREMPLSLVVGASALYLAESVLYLQLRFLLSRGYSLRMLVDLLERGGTARMEELKSGYGNGKGLEGLLERRMSDLVGQRLVCREGNRIGPLTSSGRLQARSGGFLRRLLCMERVG